MNYSDTINWMFAQLPMYQNKGKSAYKADLNNTVILTKHLDNPEKKFKSVHIAGTNGKGSTSHILASILQEANYKVGLYTSPHLKDFRERIKINGKEVSKQFVIKFIEKHKSFFEKHNLSFFEMTVCMAFDYFAKKEVDIAIIEVGLGGRLDSTNVITPEISVITNIGLDHTQFLGNTLSSIAKEKAGIIKNNVPVIIGETHVDTESVFKAIAKERNAPIVFVDDLEYEEFTSDLKGSYQKKNINTAVQTIKSLNDKAYSISTSHIKWGALKVIENTGLKGRWQVLQDEPKIICDTAHNKEGLTFTMTQLLQGYFDELHIVLGFVNDKSLEEIIPLFPKNAQYYFCKPNIQRGLNAEVLQQKFQKKKYEGEYYASVKEALKSAKENANKSDVIYVGGSTFVVAEII